MDKPPSLHAPLPALRRVSAADVIVATVVARVAAAHRCRSASPARRQFFLVRYGAVFNVAVQLCVGLDGDCDEAGSHAMMSG